MKKVFVHIAVLFCSSAVFFACDDAQTTGGDVALEHFQMIFNPELTRTTAANDGTVSWTAGDKLEVLHRRSSSSSYTKDGSFTIKNVATGLSESDGTVVLDESVNYEWFAFYPYGGSVQSPSEVSLSIPAQQTQNGEGSLAHLAGSGAPLFGTGTSTGTDVPTIQMHQVASGVKITVANNSGKAISVSKLTFAVNGNLAGSFAADLSGTTPVLTPGSAVSQVVLNIGSAVSIANGSSALFSILVAPCILSGSINITVETSNGLSQTFTKTVSGLAFESGKLNDTSVSFTETPVEVPGDEPASYGAVPTDAQVAWQRQELIMFCHFGPATFSGVAGDYGTRTANQLLSDYRPSAINTDQWADVAMRNGFGEIILTAKHHDGFCLFDNPYITCDVEGTNTTEAAKIDVVASLYGSCQDKGLRFGIYMSPWDKVDDTYGTSTYNTHYNTVLDSLMSTYRIDEFWFDGYTGGSSMSYDWSTFDNTVLSKNPDCLIFSNEGVSHYPSVVSSTDGNYGCRWVGNEDGVAGETNWSTFNTHASSQSGTTNNYATYLSQGDQGGRYWVPAESDLSLRVVAANYGWFWNANATRRSASYLLDIYYKSVGRNSVMLLNVPPNQNGELDSEDVAVLETFHGYLTDIFGTNLISGATVDDESTEARGYNYKAEYAFDGNENTYWAVSGDGTTSATLTLDLDGTKNFNVISLQEFIKKGQRVKSFTVQYYDGSWHSFASGTTIGAKRLIKGSTVNASKIRITFNSLACPLINEIGLYKDTKSSR